MAVSGLNIDQSVTRIYEKMDSAEIVGCRLMLNKEKNPDAIILEEGSEIPAKKLGKGLTGNKNTLKKIREGFKEDNVRWGVARINFLPDAKNSTTKPEFFLLSWTPDSAAVKQKMVAASSKETLKKALGKMASHEVQLSSLEDVTVNFLHSKAGQMAKVEVKEIDGKPCHGKMGCYTISDDSDSSDD